MGEVWDLVVSAFPAPRTAPAFPGDRWAPMVTPPLPLDWPDGPLVYYAYARRMRSGLVDGEEVSEPWARIERRRRLLSERLEIVPLASEIVPHTVQGVRPLTDGEQALFAEVAAAGPLEDQLVRARQDAAAATLVRRSYCHWQSIHAIASTVLPRHPKFVKFLACKKITAVVERVPPPSFHPLAHAEFNRRWPRSPTLAWQLRTTDGFPRDWPAEPRTPIHYYAYSIRVDHAFPVPKPRETTAPWGLIVRDGQGGAVRFEALADLPVSLGVQQGKAPSDAHFALLRSLGNDLDGMLVRAVRDPGAADRLRRWYRDWIDDEPLLSPILLARHPAFAAFLGG